MYIQRREYTSREGQASVIHIFDTNSSWHLRSSFLRHTPIDSSPVAAYGLP